MQVVIDIDDKLYNRIKCLEPKSDTMLDGLMRSIQNGTPLPGEEERASDCPLVKIVTCKDCKHLCHIEDVPKVLVCGKHNCQQVSGNFYCADGERGE